ncbi:MAG: calcium-binding protein [Leptolyngbyaceae bacterium]|nr:calcium-binding protein [Leptolyngbyaceae bacterium]
MDSTAADISVFNNGFDDVFGGTPGDDVLRGTSGRDLLRGLGGSDRLLGRAGNDRLSGRQDRDRLLGGRGNDQIKGGGDDDELNGEDGGDRLFGGSGADQLSGDSGEDELRGNSAQDTLLGGDGDDILVGGRGADFLQGDAGSDRLTGGIGVDTFALTSSDGISDTIVDFSLEQDFIALNGLVFADLTLETQGSDTVITVTETNVILAVVVNISVEQLTISAETYFVDINTCGCVGGDDVTAEATVTLTNGYEVSFLGVSYGTNTSTWSYYVEELPIAQDLSNWVLELPDCATVVSASPNGELVNPDPNAGISGIKWQPGGGFVEGEFSVTLSGEVTLGEVDVAVKGPDVAFGILPGPTC